VATLDLAAEWGHEEVLVLQDAASGLRGVVAVHEARRGPAIAATRLWPEASFDEALGAALRLSRAMTRETGGAGLAYGGASAVLIGPGARSKDRPLLSAYARVLERFAGRVLAAADRGFEERDLTVLGRMTKHVAYKAGAGEGAADWTAQGVVECVRETARQEGRELDGLHVAVQGLGQIGYRVARRLAAEGARITAADTDAARRERAQDELSLEVVAPGEIYDVEADVFSPNAGGAGLDESTIPRLRCRAVAGGARDVLAGDGEAELLHERGILYAPDFVVGAGGLAAALDLAAADEDDREMVAQERVGAVSERLREIFRLSREDGMSPLRVAQRLLGVS
jgi:leucine dehydrogenase